VRKRRRERDQERERERERERSRETVGYTCEALILGVIDHVRELHACLERVEDVGQRASTSGGEGGGGGGGMSVIMTYSVIMTLMTCH
jgi:hypothetical protein